MKHNKIKIRMKFYLVTIILLLFFNIYQINCLKLSNFCKRAKTNKCESYQCGTFFCSIDKQSCQDFIIWAKLMSKYSNQSQNNYNKFVDNIKRCRTIGGHKNQWMHRLNFG